MGRITPIQLLRKSRAQMFQREQGRGARSVHRNLVLVGSEPDAAEMLGDKLWTERDTEDTFLDSVHHLANQKQLNRAEAFRLKRYAFYHSEQGIMARGLLNEFRKHKRAREFAAESERQRIARLEDMIAVSKPIPDIFLSDR